MPKLILAEGDLELLLLLHESQMRLVLESYMAGERKEGMTESAVAIYCKLVREGRTRAGTNERTKRYLERKASIDASIDASINANPSPSSPSSPPLSSPPPLSPTPPISTPPIIPPTPPTPPTPPAPSKARARAKEKPKVQWAEFVTMTNDEHDKLLATYGPADTERLIEILDNYKGSSGKKYASDYRAILSWVVDRLKEDKEKDKQKTGNVFLDMLNERRSVIDV